MGLKLVARATCSCHWLIIGKKWKLVITAIALQIWWLPLQQKGKIKILKKMNYSEAVWRIKLKLCRIVSNISLYKKILCLLPLLKYIGCYSSLKVSIDLQWETENWDLLLSHCRYIDKSFTEMFVEWCSTKHIISDQLKSKMSSFKSNENIHKKEDGS